MFSHFNFKKFTVLLSLALCFMATDLFVVMAADSTHVHEIDKSGRYYYCPMHPQVVSDKPGNCPICNMKLVLNDPSKSSSEKSAIEGLVPVNISTSEKNSVGIRTETAEQRPFQMKIEAWGEVAHDFELYELQIEFLRQERIQYEKVRDRTPVAQKRGVTEREKIAVKFQEMGLSSEWVKALDDAGVPDKRLIEHHAGADIWVYLQVREKDGVLLKAGDIIHLSVPSLSEYHCQTKVESVDSIVDMQTNTVRVRALVQNNPPILKPNMKVNAVIEVDLGQTIVISEEAPLFTGNRWVVFVEENGMFSPREVMLGTKSDGHYQVISGLKAGEKICSSGNFFVDSESRLRSSVAGASHEGHRS